LTVGLVVAFSTPLVRELEDNQTRLNTIVATAADGILSTDETGLIESMNDAAVAIFGYREDQLVGQNFTVLLSSRYRESSEDDLESFLAVNGINAIGTTSEVIGLRHDGESFPMELSVSRAEMDDEQLFIIVARDISVQKKAQEDLIRAREWLEQQVAMRTADLKETNSQLEAEVQKRRKTQAQLEQSQEALEGKVAQRTADLERANRNLRKEISERIRTQRALKEAQLELENRIEERTRDLRDTNVRLKQEIHEREHAEKEREALIAQLREALSKIRTLKGLIPICAACKRVRDDSGFWNQIEAYITEHSDADFSHGICPECAQKLYPHLTGISGIDRELPSPESEFAPEE